jgi:serine/threonine protein phosphatase PrpC
MKVKRFIGSSFFIGKSHVKHGLLCQDRAYTAVYDGYKILALSDGMGSYPQSHLGAEFVTRYICDIGGNIYREYLESLPEDYHKNGSYQFDETEFTEFKEDLLKEIRRMQVYVKTYATQIGLTLDDLHCTLSFVIIGPKKILSVAIGDSPIFIKKKNGEYRIIRSPVADPEALNITYSALDSENETMAISIDPIESIESVAIMSDGCFNKNDFENELTNMKDHPSWLYNLIECKKNYDKIIKKLVSEGYDDCSFAFFYNAPNSIKG